MSEFTPPADVDAEMAVLGAAMLLPRTLERISAILAQSDFYRPAHGTIFGAMQRLIARGQPVDQLSLHSELRDCGVLDMVGGMDYLYRIGEVPGSAANAEHYARRIAEHAARRRLIANAYGIIGAAQDTARPIAEIMGEAETAVLDTSSPTTISELRPVADFSAEVMAQIMARRQAGANIAGLASALTNWDTMLSGLQPSNLVTIAGRPAMGKTAAAVTIALNIAGNLGNVAFFSLEMSRHQLMARMLAAASGIDSRRVVTGRVTDMEVPRLRQAAGMLGTLPLYICEEPGLTPGQILSQCRRMRSQLGRLDLVIVDYLQIMSPDNARRGGTRDEEIGAIARGLKAIAKRLDVPVIALAQLNRRVENRENKRPIMSDLEGSGKVEAESDSVTMLYRPAYYASPPPDEAPPPERDEAEWIVAKNRHGGTGVVKLSFAPALCRFDNATERDPW